VVDRADRRKRIAEVIDSARKCIVNNLGDRRGGGVVMYSPGPTVAESRRRCGNSSSTIGVFSTQLYRQAGKANCFNTMRSKASLAYMRVLNQPNLVGRFGRLVCVLE